MTRSGLSCDNVYGSGDMKLLGLSMIERWQGMSDLSTVCCTFIRVIMKYMPTTAPLNGQYEIVTYRNNTTVPLVQHILVVSGRLNVPGHIPFPFPPYPY
jgi:hypothetical protein